MLFLFCGDVFHNRFSWPSIEEWILYEGSARASFSDAVGCIDPHEIDEIDDMS